MSESIFDNLEAIRLTPDAAATAGTREILRHVPSESRTARSLFVCIPMRRCSWRLAFSWIGRNGRRSLWCPICAAISRQGVVFLWPVPLPDEGGRRNAWGETAREACELAIPTVEDDA
jgi:hypothetical protein